MGNFPVDAIGVLSFFVIVLISFVVGARLCSVFCVGFNRLILLYFWHLFFVIVYAFYVMNYGGDAEDYYKFGTSLSEFEFGFGTDGIKFVVQIIYFIFRLDFFSMSLVFGFFGFLGLIAFDAALRAVTNNSVVYVKRMASLVVFLPSINFWSSGLGKDSLAVMSIGLLLWATLDFKRRMPLVLFSVALMFFVRPHMGGLLVVCLAINFIFSRKISAFKLFALIPAGVAVAAVAVPFALNYAGLGEAQGISDTLNYVEERQGYNQEGGGGLSIFHQCQFTFRFLLICLDRFLLKCIALQLLRHLSIMFLFF